MDLEDNAYLTIVTGTQADFDRINNFPLLLQVYPNPAAGNFTIKILNSAPLEGNLRIFNSLGQEVENHTISAGKRMIFNSQVNRFGNVTSKRPLSRPRRILRAASATSIRNGIGNSF